LLFLLKNQSLPTLLLLYGLLVLLFPFLSSSSFSLFSFCCLPVSVLSSSSVSLISIFCLLIFVYLLVYVQLMSLLIYCLLFGLCVIFTDTSRESLFFKFQFIFLFYFLLIISIHLTVLYNLYDIKEKRNSNSNKVLA
jgi:hypothetical protein